MTKLFRQKFLFLYTLLIGFLILLLIPATICAAPASEPEPAKLEDFNTFSSQTSIDRHSPSRIVMQIIENRFYKWQEYENPATGKVAIYQLKPEEAALCSDKAYELLQLSGQWENETYTYHSARTNKKTENSTYSVSETDLEAPDKHIESLRENINFTGLMTDDRTEVKISDADTYPYNTIGFLTTDFPYEFMRGTGFLVSPHTAITNAHNVYSPHFGGWYKTIRFTPAQYEDANMDIITPYSTINPDKAVVNSAFKDYEDSGDREKAINHDYAAIFFETPINGIDTFMPLEFNYMPENISLIGYPGNVRGKLTLGMWLSEGPLIKSDDYCLYYEAYTSGGNSGSPVFVYNETAGTYRVVAIHSFASINYFSGGPHLNDKNRSIIEEWLRWTPEKDTAIPPAEADEEAHDGQEVMVPDISLNETRISMVKGDSKTLVETVNSDDISYDELIWISDNPQIVTVEDNGIVTAVREGKTTVRVMTPDGRVEAGCEVTVLSTTGGRLPGDINGDNLVDVQDVVIVTRHVLNYASLSEKQMQIADVNNDGIVDVQDVALIMQFALGLIDTL